MLSYNAPFQQMLWFPRITRSVERFKDIFVRFLRIKGLSLQCFQVNLNSARVVHSYKAPFLPDSCVIWLFTLEKNINYQHINILSDYGEDVEFYEFIFTAGIFMMIQISDG